MGWYYSTVNSEVDFPELGHYGKWDSAMYNVYLTEKEAIYLTKTLPHRVSDGKYHKYSMVWRTDLVDTDCRTTVEHPLMPKRYYCNDISSKDQSFPTTTVEGRTKIYRGVRTDFYIDDVFVVSAVNPDPVPAVAAQLCIANWLPDWAGPANFDMVSMFVSEVSIQPFNDPGDVCWQNQSYPSDGLIKPSSVVNNPKIGIPTIIPISPNATCIPPSYCKCFQYPPRCYGSNELCYCGGTYPGYEEFLRKVRGGTTTPAPTVPGQLPGTCVLPSFCKCWNTPPTCHGTDSPCTCTDTTSTTTSTSATTRPLIHNETHGTLLETTTPTPGSSTTIEPASILPVKSTISSFNVQSTSRSTETTKSTITTTASRTTTIMKSDHGIPFSSTTPSPAEPTTSANSTNSTVPLSSTSTTLQPCLFYCRCWQKRPTCNHSRQPCRC